MLLHRTSIGLLSGRNLHLGNMWSVRDKCSSGGLWIYASAVVGRTLTNRVLVSRDLTEESAGSSGKQKYLWIKLHLRRAVFKTFKTLQLRKVTLLYQSS